MIERQAAPLREQAREELRRRILNGSIAPGQRLKERVLLEELGVSRTVVREALRQLESERLIRIEPQVGPVVSEITAEEARQLYEVRAALEATAARLAALHATPEDTQALRDSLDTIEQSLPGSEELIELKNTFYGTLIRASRNEIIGEQLESVQARISQLRRVTLSEPGRGPRMVDELRRVVDAISQGDPEAAYAASVAHVEAAAVIARQYFEQSTEAQ
ncbi:GntR family transcriptional regulator [Microbacterium album]|uniref:GntR family transcriptional regulator n=1 Tax=Microbacterium album TaxID=2053191 RepID=A0A917MPH1_9MICO|nr:GntR family transcriptional regulator [Microbacterium album]GGH47420.1 GntR family transcriptional regulator [Microbacterium album]